jgi:succinyl-CoA synthetase beta subunit
MGHHGRTVAKALKLSGDLAKQAEKLTAQLYAAFVAKDMSMLEINPLVVRLEGTNVDAGKKIIRESGLNVLPADDLDDAAQKIVKAVKGG